MFAPILNGSLEHLPNQHWGSFLSHRDQKRVSGNGGKLRVAGMLLRSLPSPPFIYYGESGVEISEDGHFTLLPIDERSGTMLQIGITDD